VTRIGGFGRLIACLVVACAVGCGEGPGEEQASPEEPAYIIRVKPGPGGILCEGGDVTLVFNRDPGVVRSSTASIAPYSPTGTTRIFWAAAGRRQEFAWGDGESLSVDYNMVPCEPEPATLDSVSPAYDGPASLPVLRADGIVLTFSEDVYAPDGDWDLAFKIVPAEGEGWRPSASVDGAEVTLRESAADRFVAGQTSSVQGTVTDRGGNETDVRFFIVVVDGDE